MAKAAKAGRLLAYLDRTGNSSTKPFKTGANEHLSEWPQDLSYLKIEALKKLEQHRSGSEARQKLRSELRKIEASILEYNSRIQKRKYQCQKDVEAFERQRSVLGARKLELCKELSVLKGYSKKERKLTMQGFNNVFVELAKDMLPEFVFDEIKNTTLSILEMD